MDILDLKDKLTEMERSMGCLSGLLLNQTQLTVTGGELAAVIGTLQREIANIEQQVINLRYPGM